MEASLHVFSNITGEGVIRVFFIGGFCNVADPGSHGGINAFDTGIEVGAECPDDDILDGDDTEFLLCVMCVPCVW